ncbi:alkaline phosphatase family protein [Pontiella sulfatireligans]|uniref:sulfatase-like hydrolase/transferase n=1 Tax=Pontiella sulfatireligans TaxID=2750658 RepID=UPI0014449438|nr:sulfatase-like hydrolase/transferase [Pontiella sulfatireligans]
MKGGKGKATEGGLWVPCLVSWPGHLPENVDREELCGHIDWFMTFASLAGRSISAPGQQAWDGRNMLPVLSGAADAGWNNRLFVGHRARWKNGEAAETKYVECSIQNGDFKLYNHKHCHPTARKQKGWLVSSKSSTRRV